jgi:hypothetical protein
MPGTEPETLAFEVREGHLDNRFFRRGPVAAHLLSTSGPAPRIIVAFPAGNAGVGLWFEALAEPAELAIEGSLSAVERGDGMRGIAATFTTTARELRVRGAVLGSVRALREFARTSELGPGMAPRVVHGSPLILERTTVDGRHHLALALDPHDGATVSAGGDGRIVLAAGPGRLRFTLTALADDPPLTPIQTRDLLVDGASAEPRALSALAFLAYEEKLLAGSWRFLTYFGRDTLLSVRMLLPVLRPGVVEAGLGAVIDRLGPGGDVAHEESIGEWAALEHLAAGRRPEDPREPIYDEKMIDDDFLLAPVAAAYLLDQPAGRARAEAFLGRRTPSGERYAAALARNLGLVLRLAAPFAEAPSAGTLVGLKAGSSVGEWRDSEEGLGFGRTPFNVNVALIPAALEAAARLFAIPLLGADRALADRAGALAAAWAGAGAFFRVEIPAPEAERRLSSYARSLGVDPSPALGVLDGHLAFPALALDAAGRPIPVMHSDDSFVLLFTDPSPETLEEAAARICRPFPLGLRTPVGVVVANPAFCPDGTAHALFTSGHYHGTVIWSWQQAMLVAGIDRQLARAGLPAATRAALGEAREALGEAIRATEAWRASELWSWIHVDGRFERVPFGADRGHHDEANAAQLWSTVYLGTAL